MLPTDFSVYYRALERLDQGKTPYVAEDSSPYKYSPGALAILRALPNDLSHAWVAYSAFSILMLMVGLALGSRYASWDQVGLLGVGVILAWKGILETLDYGQLELVIFGIAVLAFAIRRSVPLLAGVLAGTLPWLKLPWGLLLLPLILVSTESLQKGGVKEKRTRIFITGYVLAALAWGAGVPSVLFGSNRAMELTREWIEILRVQPGDLYSTAINQSLWSTLHRWISESQLAVGLGLIGVSWLLGRLVIRSLSTHLTREVFVWVTPWLILIQLLNPLSWRWGSVFVIGAPLAAWRHDQGSSLGRSILWGCVALLYLIQLNPVVQFLGYAHWTQFHEWGAVTLFWIALLGLTLHRDRNSGASL
jgi:hypothetical protein